MITYQTRCLCKLGRKNLLHFLFFLLTGCIGTICPCFLFGKNAEFLGSGTLAGSCMTHLILYGLVNCFCCLFSGGILLGFPGTMVACYACGYRKALRTKYNLEVCNFFKRNYLRSLFSFSPPLSCFMKLVNFECI